MTRRDDTRIIGIVHPICCGLDVHKESISACVIFPDGVEFRDLGEDYLRLRNKSQKLVHLRKQALALGYDLVLQAV